MASPKGASTCAYPQGGRRRTEMSGTGRILGLDVGDRRIGLAVSDPGGRLAVPLRVLEREDNEVDLQALLEIARAEEIQTLVVGYPLSLDGTAGPQAKRVASFAHRLAQASGIPYKLWDERLTSAQAEQRRRGGRSRARPGIPKTGRRRAPVDDLAAAIMLQSFLDRRRRDQPLPARP